MIRIGITGSNGFVGWHLRNWLLLKPEKFVLIEFNRLFFQNDEALDNFVLSCDVIVHLAAVNRADESKDLFEINFSLAKLLVASLQRTLNKCHLIFTSSIQEYLGNDYGLGKKLARELFSDWAFTNKRLYSGLLLPNVFGPFSKPNYNTVVATFCQQILEGTSPNIIVDKLVPLVYIGNLVKKIEDIIVNSIVGEKIAIEFDFEMKVKELAFTFERYKSIYFDNGIIPELLNNNDINLFNTFRSFIPLKLLQKSLIKNSDERGDFLEVIRSRIGGQFSYSTTNPRITRGNHFHTRKIERFCVIKGNAIIQMRKVGSATITEFQVSGDDPAVIDIPIWHVHNLMNCGNSELVTLFWINEVYNPDDPDTYFQNV